MLRDVNLVCVKKVSPAHSKKLLIKAATLVKLVT